MSEMKKLKNKKGYSCYVRFKQLNLAKTSDLSHNSIIKAPAPISTHPATAFTDTSPC